MEDSEECTICKLNAIDNLNWEKIPFKGPANEGKCHLVCAAFVREVHLEMDNTQIVATTSSLLNGLDYRQQLCQDCGEIDDRLYLKCANGDCTSQFHIECAAKANMEVIFCEEPSPGLDILCHDHMEQEQQNKLEWNILEMKIKKRLVEQKDGKSMGSQRQDSLETGNIKKNVQMVSQISDEINGQKKIEQKKHIKGKDVRTNSSIKEIEDIQNVIQEVGFEQKQQQQQRNNKRAEKSSKWRKIDNNNNTNQILKEKKLKCDDELDQTNKDEDIKLDGEMEEEQDQKAKRKANGIPIYPSWQTETSKESLMKQWWAQIEEVFFCEIGEKQLEDMNDYGTSHAPINQMKKSIYWSLLTRESFEKGCVPSIRNGTYLTLLFSNNSNLSDNHLLRFRLSQEPLDITTQSKLKSQSPQHPQFQIKSILQILEPTFDGIFTVKPSDEVKNSNIIPNENNLKLQYLIEAVHAQRLDEESFHQIIQTTRNQVNFQKTKTSNNKIQIEKKNLNKEINGIQNDLGCELDWETTYLETQLEELSQINEITKKRITEQAKQYQSFPDIQVLDLEQQCKEVQDAVKWNTVIRSMQVGYSEKLPELLLTYSKVEEEQTAKNKTGITLNSQQSQQQSQPQMCLRNTDGYIEIDCKVCFNNHSSDSNPVVYCSLCSASFHQFCYGIRSIPQDDFYCDMCLNRRRNALKAPRSLNPSKQEGRREHKHLCAICQKRGFPMMDIKGQFYHVSCLAFLNLICIREGKIALREGNSESAITAFQHKIDILVVKSELSSPLCVICGKKFGYKLRCSHPGCLMAFHTHCAYIQGVYFDIQLIDDPKHQMIRSLAPSIFCFDHQPLKDRKVSLQTYLRRYGINLFKTATEFSSFAQFANAFENEEQIKIREDISINLNTLQASAKELSQGEAAASLALIETCEVSVQDDYLSVFETPKEQQILVKNKLPLQKPLKETEIGKKRPMGAKNTDENGEPKKKVCLEKNNSSITHKPKQLAQQEHGSITKINSGFQNKNSFLENNLTQKKSTSFGSNQQQFEKDTHEINKIIAEVFSD